VRLPRTAADVGSQTVPVKDGAPQSAEPSGVRVLIVDDNVDAALLLGEALTQCGHEIRIASDGLQALHVASSFRPHVALLDIGLPVMDGFEVARQIRASPELASTSLVAVTGYGQVHDRERTLAAGFDVHLVKPVDLQRVSALIAQLADASAIERSPQS
jgi:CheY-like chemotaxis protein